MKKYSDDPIVEFTHNARKERDESILRAVTGDYTTPIKQLESRVFKKATCKQTKQ